MKMLIWPNIKFRKHGWDSHLAFRAPESGRQRVRVAGKIGSEGFLTERSDLSSSYGRLMHKSDGGSDGDGHTFILNSRNSKRRPLFIISSQHFICYQA